MSNTENHKTREELEAMTTKKLKEYAKEIGCCLGYDGSRKDTTVAAILAHQSRIERGEPVSKGHPWRKLRSVKGGAR